MYPSGLPNDLTSFARKAGLQMKATWYFWNLACSKCHSMGLLKRQLFPGLALQDQGSPVRFLAGPSSWLTVATSSAEPPWQRTALGPLFLRTHSQTRGPALGNSFYLRCLLLIGPAENAVTRAPVLQMWPVGDTIQSSAINLLFAVIYLPHSMVTWTLLGKITF